MNSCSTCLWLRCKQIHRFLSYSIQLQPARLQDTPTTSNAYYKTHPLNRYHCLVSANFKCVKQLLFSSGWKQKNGLKDTIKLCRAEAELVMILSGIVMMSNLFHTHKVMCSIVNKNRIIALWLYASSNQSSYRKYGHNLPLCS